MKIIDDQITNNMKVLVSLEFHHEGGGGGGGGGGEEVATEMLSVLLEGRSKTNSPRQQFHSQPCCQIIRYFYRTLYNKWFLLCLLRF